MAKKPASTSLPASTIRPPYMLIEEIRVQGYKSLANATTLQVRPLTLLAGTNSSGKSSIMQPLLLIKQTMEAPYQPAGALVLDGAHVQAETADELVSKVGKNLNKKINILIKGQSAFHDDETPFENAIQLTYEVKGQGFELVNQKALGSETLFELKPDSTWKDIETQLTGDTRELLLGKKEVVAPRVSKGFIELSFGVGEQNEALVFSYFFELSLSTLFHIPGLRGAPKRSYPATFFNKKVKGTFDLYAAGTVSQWQEQKNVEALAQLNDYLFRLGLTDAIAAKIKNANEIELNVSRLPTGGKGKPRKADMVNIADVGIGVSQVLPILVALIAAREGQIVYVEQPELHLHPRAQATMAELLAEAANRGVRVIVETHSSLLLLKVQTLIAQGKIKNTDVALHWFARDTRGASAVTHVQPDEDGAYGEWPEDFGDVELRAQDEYLTAVGELHFGKAPE